MKYEFSIGYDYRGSQMGRSNIVTEPDIVAKFYLQHVLFTDGCYDPGGAYWGYPANLYIAWTVGSDEEQRCFVRAWSREEAKKLVRETFPNAKFYR